MVLRRAGARLADHPDDLSLGVVGHLVRDRFVRRARNLRQQLIPLCRRRRQFLLEPPEIILDLLQLLDLLGRRLALQLLAPAKLVDLRHQLAPALVRGEELVECLRAGGALARDGPAEPVGIGPRGSEVDQPFVR